MLDTFLLYNDLCLEIEVLKEQLQLAESEREQWWVGGRLFASVPMDNAAERFDKLTDKIEHMEKILEAKVTTKEKIESLMNGYEELPRKIAYLRYVHGRSLKDIAADLNYSYDYVREVMSKMKKSLQEPTHNEPTDILINS
ncbi:DNA-directed RNA polymerase specialized sigma24 family protein [Cytobacillus horneckiae]|uniref:sigma-70 family RNA polymerase sigma factor n=1 Tax=Cytobacillus horneckiae TaxID=549687 RepID=UPI0019D0BC0C|nr:sigma-70 family RNA polymerase sigma factor [Cytobacillus horneckiae]MBN6887010.1 sigma-70 family RNA polymerase sigma factor [Cytobacillus horneckiae]